MKTYRAAVIGCSRMGVFIDNEVVGAPGQVPPYSHAAVFSACPRTELAALSDLRPDVMAEAGRQYDVPAERQYTDYRRLIDAEQPDIVSVATQPEHRADIVIYAAEHGARAIYAEKALSASMAEADAIVEACERNGVVLNLGTQRRWHPGFTKMRDLINGGELGALQTIVFVGSSLFNGLLQGIALNTSANAITLINVIVFKHNEDAVGNSWASSKKQKKKKKRSEKS